MKLGFIGLGQMGREMAGRLIEAGHELAVYNRSRAAAEPFRTKGAKVADEPIQVLDADVVITMVADDAAIDAVWVNSGLARSMPAAGIHLNMSTIVESLGEAFALTRKSGVDPATFLHIIASTAMNAPAYKIYGRTMVAKAFEPTFTLRLGLKDVELALEAGGDTHVPLPLAGVIREQHIAAIAHGFGDEDWAALGEYIAQNAGLR